MDVVHDRSIELLDTAPAASPDPLGGDLGKPALHQIQPGAVRRREVYDKSPRPCCQEVTHPFGVVTGGVVNDQVQHLLL